MNRRHPRNVAIHLAELKQLIAHWRKKGENTEAIEIQIAFWSRA